MDVNIFDLPVSRYAEGANLALTKKMVKNDSRVQHFYVEDSHPAIIGLDEFDAFQIENKRCKGLGRPTSCTCIFFEGDIEDKLWQVVGA